MPPARRVRPAAFAAVSLVVSFAVVVVDETSAHAAGPATAPPSGCGTTLLSTCINDDTLWPHAGPSRFLSIGSVETLASGQVGFGLVSSYLSRPVVLHIPSPGPGGTDVPAINDQVNGTFLWAYGVSDRLQLDAALPITFGQGGAGTAPITGADSATAIQDTALRDLRFGFAYALLPRARVEPRSSLPTARALNENVGITARLEVSAPTGDKSQFAGERTAVFIPSVAADYRHDRIFAGLEVGARVRPVTELLGARVGSQAMVAVGMGVDILARELLSAAIEARALPTFDEQHKFVPTNAGFVSASNGKHIMPAEWDLEVRTAPLFGGDFALEASGGGAIPFSSDPVITNPRFRFNLGIRYAPLARDTDGDGILDKNDKCPDQRGIAGSPDGDGCPRAPEPERIDLQPGAGSPATHPSPSPALPAVSPAMPSTGGAA